jgi:hypothetical protein
MSLFISSLLPIAIDLIHELVRDVNPLTIERKKNYRSKGRQTEIEEKLDDCDSLSDNYPKVLPDCPPILNIMSSAIGNREQRAIPHRILNSH